MSRDGTRASLGEAWDVPIQTQDDSRESYPGLAGATYEHSDFLAGKSPVTWNSSDER